MGISSTGILFYGIDYGENYSWLKEDESYEDNNVDPDEFLWLANGAKATDSYEIRRDAANDLGVEMILHCSYDYAMYGLGVIESNKRAHRGYPVAIKELIIKPEWEVMLWIAREKLAKFTENNAWLQGDPSWVLTSVYG